MKLLFLIILLVLNISCNSQNENDKYEYIIFGFTENNSEFHSELLFKLKLGRINIYSCETYNTTSLDCNKTKGFEKKYEVDQLNLYEIPKQFFSDKEVISFISLNNEAFYTIKYKEKKRKDDYY